MDRRKFLKISALGVFGVSAGLAGKLAYAAEGRQAKKPNLVYVFPDEMRGSAMGFLGEEPVITPNLDRFAQASLVLPEAVSNYPVCVPYRTIMMTGKYPFGNGVLVNCFCDGRDLPKGQKWWTDVLDEKGYSIGYYGKWHITKPMREYKGHKLKGQEGKWLPPDRRHGIDYWRIHTTNNHLKNRYVSYDRPCVGGVKVREVWTPEFETDCAIDFIRNEAGKYRKEDQPFALVLSYNPPHSPYQVVPQKYVEMYDQDVEQYCGGVASVPGADERWGKYYRRNIRQYYGAITGIDEQFGRILDCLKEQGIEDDTIVVFTSDHGNCLGRHGHVSKNVPEDDSMRVPFIVRWPGKVKAEHDDLLISTGDIYPTLMELMGTADGCPDDLEGQSWAKIFTGGEQERPSSQLYMHVKEPEGDERYGRRGVRTHRYTLNIEKMPGNAVEVLLYDRKSDPYQVRNIAGERYDVVERLIEKELRPWQAKIRDSFVLPDLGFLKEGQVRGPVVEKA
ncbi:sulfatase [Anaerohalosphaera lusitana]|nr:sulfatase [Anaerohalosphaera lusitana]